MRHVEVRAYRVSGFGVEVIRIHTVDSRLVYIILCIGVGNGGAQGARAPQKIAAPYIFKAASLIRTIHVHPECPSNQIMFLHQCYGLG